MKRALIQSVLLVLAATALAAAYWSVRLAYAEAMCSLGTRASLRKAVSIAVGSARFQQRLATFADLEGFSHDESDRALRAAVRANPGDSESLIELGLRAEARQELPEAEALLLEAARRDAGYDPRWSLANFYFRQQNDSQFWKWARAAGEMAYEPAALFQLMWRYTNDPEAVVRRGLPDRPELLRAYVRFLLGQTNWEAAKPAVTRLIATAGEDDAPLLLAYCDRLLWAQRGLEAQGVWNTLARRQLIKFPALDPERGPVLVNDDFALPITNLGFDWHFEAVQGVTASQEKSELEVTFSGNQPEAWDPLWQWIVLKGGGQNRLTFRYAARDVGAATGLRWRVVDLTNQPRVLGESKDLSNEEWTDGAVVFRAPEGVRLMKVALSYQRALGTTRIEGSVRIRQVRLGAVN